ncbi:MAG TPA: hypothetical protein VFQ53_34430 [Kofleriaceae bacterium]|nr:hypothetical protein [Kofleriaceae bacterium]
MCASGKVTEAYIEERNEGDLNAITQRVCRRTDYAVVSGRVRGSDAEQIVVTSATAQAVQRDGSFSILASVGVTDIIAMATKVWGEREWQTERILVKRGVLVPTSSALSLEIDFARSFQVAARPVRVSGIMNGEVLEATSGLRTANGVQTILSIRLGRAVSVAVPDADMLLPGDQAINRILAVRNGSSRFAIPAADDYWLAAPLGDVEIRRSGRSFTVTWEQYTAGSGYLLEVSQLINKRPIHWKIRIPPNFFSRKRPAYALPALPTVRNGSLRPDSTAQADWKLSAYGALPTECDPHALCSGILSTVLASRWGRIEGQ